jgi:hypothetical protein
MPASAPQPPRTFLLLTLAVLVGLPLVVIVGLAAVGYVGAVFAVAGVFGLAAVHYVVWGWWLSRFIRQGAAPDDFED